MPSRLTPEQLEQRFWRKVDRKGENECWEWLASLTSDGYGRLKWDDKVERAHCIAWELAAGQKRPPGLLVRHSCDNPSCCNPAHLLLGTIADNNSDRMERSGYARIYPSGGRPRQQAARKWKSGTEPTPIKDRIMAGVRVDEDGCWIWVKAQQSGRLSGRVIKHGGHNVTVRRAVYEAFVGPIPDGMVVLLACANRACINPRHLRCGNHNDLMADMVVRGRIARGADNHFGKVKFQGVDNARSKLTIEAVREIRAGVPTKVIMERYGVSKPTVSHVRAGRTWTHVPM